MTRDWMQVTWKRLGTRMLIWTPIRDYCGHPSTPPVKPKKPKFYPFPTPIRLIFRCTLARASRGSASDLFLVQTFSFCRRCFNNSAEHRQQRSSYQTLAAESGTSCAGALLCHFQLFLFSSSLPIKLLLTPQVVHFLQNFFQLKEKKIIFFWEDVVMRPNRDGFRDSQIHGQVTKRAVFTSNRGGRRLGKTIPSSQDCLLTWLSWGKFWSFSNLRCGSVGVRWVLR